MGVLQQRHCARDFVVEDIGLAREELFSCGIFVFDYFRDDGFFKLGDYVGLGDAECHLVGNLVEVTRSFSSFTEEASDGQAHSPCGIEEFFDLFGHFQGGKVEHYGNSYTRSQIGRAGSKVSISRAKGEIDLLFNHIVDFIYLFGALRELAAGLEHLQAQMVLLVNHSGEKFSLYHNDASRAFAEGMMAANEMAFDKEMSAESGGLVHADVGGFIAKLK